MPLSSGFARAFGSALGIEALAIAALVAWLSSQPAKEPLMVVPLQIEPAIPEPEKPLPKIEPRKPPPEPAPVRAVEPPKVQPKLAPPPVATPAPPAPDTVVTAAPAPVAAPVPAHSPVPVVASAPPPPPPPLPPVVNEPDPLPGYRTQLSAAAQAAFALPQTAIDLNFRGRARIGFNLRDGAPSAITVVEPSGLGAVDRAAVKAVQTAKYPPPPSALRGKEIAYLIWVSAY